MNPRSFKIWFLLSLAAFISQCASEGRPKTESGGGGAADQTVSSANGGAASIDQQATFDFYLKHADQYKWDVRARGVLEWQWQALIELDESTTYAVGFNRSSKGGSLNEGSLSELLRAGQREVRVVTDGGTSVLSKDVKASVIRNGIRLTIEDRQIVELLHRKKPERALFQAKGESQSPSFQQNIPIQYK